MARCQCCRRRNLLKRVAYLQWVSLRVRIAQNFCSTMNVLGCLLPFLYSKHASKDCLKIKSDLFACFWDFYSVPCDRPIYRLNVVPLCFLLSLLIRTLCFRTSVIWRCSLELLRRYDFLCLRFVFTKTVCSCLVWMLLCMFPCS